MALVFLGDGTLGLAASHQVTPQVLALGLTEGALLCHLLLVGPHVQQGSLVGKSDPSRGSVPCASITVPTGKQEEQAKAREPECAKKPAKDTKLVKEAALITMEEFESVPAYMKGRLTYDQINAVVQEMNKAVVAKYKILYQPLKSMSVPVRNLYDRFMEEETKDTRGLFFIVEADIKEFTQLKLDKRFHSILNILRHCQRVREVRGSRLVRYVIC
ncbi:PREDICTED: spindle and kinetochore-associated protein 1 isoform X2 [Corvus brachyrhynchos]|uniref:spindle and kinetochore-associated protein 1 isoform X2 n=1 Tax=Corvus brachyrhynchos TaxID=85066 RepID=UPI000816582A|nr:PREDICTED: spindle and kinetochore-associated protein 1 isoform X2 [Corvus brachyrhynchos]